MQNNFYPMKKIYTLLFLVISCSLFAQDFHVGIDYFLPTDVTYNKSIPTPKSVSVH